MGFEQVQFLSKLIWWACFAFDFVFIDMVITILNLIRSIELILLLFMPHVYSALTFMACSIDSTKIKRKRVIPFPAHSYVYLYLE